MKRWMGSDTGNAPNSNPATFYYYDGQDMIQEGSSAVNATRIYVHGPGVDQIVASQAVNAGGGWEWRYHHYDGQGNCILLTNTSGGISEQYDYDAFGMPYVYNAGGATLGAAVQWGNRFLFTGREWLSDLRIYDYRARQYQPELGRFLQPDPKEFAAGDYNLYRYCHNDPVNKSDPTGLIANIAQDFRWKTNCFFDSGSNFQGSLGEFKSQTGLGGGIRLELIPAGDRHISQKDVFLKDGKTRALGLTDPDFGVSDPKQKEDGSWKVTGVYTLNVKYADGEGTTAGKNSLNHTYGEEWRHAVPLDRWYANALKTVEKMNEVFHFTSPSRARAALDAQLRPGFEQAKAASLEIHRDGSQHNSPYKYEE